MVKSTAYRSQARHAKRLLRRNYPFIIRVDCMSEKVTGSSMSLGNGDVYRRSIRSHWRIIQYHHVMIMNSLTQEKRPDKSCHSVHYSLSYHQRAITVILEPRIL